MRRFEWCRREDEYHLHAKRRCIQRRADHRFAPRESIDLHLWEAQLSYEKEEKSYAYKFASPGSITFLQRVSGKKMCFHEKHSRAYQKGQSTGALSKKSERAQLCHGRCHTHVWHPSHRGEISISLSRLIMHTRMRLDLRTDMNQLEDAMSFMTRRGIGWFGASRFI